MLPVLKVIHVIIIPVGFLLKEDVPVCHLAVPVHNNPDEPLYAIPDVEEYIEHLPHLCSMDPLMVKKGTAYYCILPAEEYAKEVYCLESPEGNNIVPYYPHTTLLSQHTLLSHH